MNKNYKRTLRAAYFTILVLLVPLIAMQLSSSVNWAASDFVVAGILLFGSGLVYEFYIKKIKSSKRRTVSALALVATFLFIWAELAVGIFGD